MEEAGHVQVVGGPDDVVEEEEVVLEGGQVLLLLPLWDIVRPALEVFVFKDGVRVVGVVGAPLEDLKLGLFWVEKSVLLKSTMHEFHPSYLVIRQGYFFSLNDDRTDVV